MKALIVCKHPENSDESNACKVIKKENLETVYSWKNTLQKKELEKIDLVVAIGGDGTVLSASHYLKDKPLLAVNSSPKTSEGALTSIPIEKLEEKLDEILAGKIKTENQLIMAIIMLYTKHILKNAIKEILYDNNNIIPSIYLITSEYFKSKKYNRDNLTPDDNMYITALIKGHHKFNSIIKKNNFF